MEITIRILLLKLVIAHGMLLDVHGNCWDTIRQNLFFQEMPMCGLPKIKITMIMAMVVFHIAPILMLRNLELLLVGPMTEKLIVADMSL